MTFGALVTALATVVLAIANGVYLKRVGKQIEQNNKNINISKDKIVLDGYIKEMDSIVGPLWSKVHVLRSYEPIHTSSQDEADIYWQSINKSKYLVPREFRLDLQIYMHAYRKQEEELNEKRRILNDVNVVLKDVNVVQRMSKPDWLRFATQVPIIDWRIYSDPVPLDIRDYNDYIEKITNEINSNDSESEIVAALSSYHKIIEEDKYIYKLNINNESINTTIKDARQKLITDIEKRHMVLEQWIENLRGEIEMIHPNL